ncbi:J domain-containing protein, partial [Acinetobacter baumannii]|uniref:J domain-containing protein n=1 Tax=Acinetobacter baumannii TaxID=470 RepID=UPI001CB87D82
MNTFINYYEILHVSQDAPVEIIRLAYKVFTVSSACSAGKGPSVTIFSEYLVFSYIDIIVLIKIIAT